MGLGLGVESSSGGVRNVSRCKGQRSRPPMVSVKPHYIATYVTKWWTLFTLVSLEVMLVWGKWWTSYSVVPGGPVGVPTCDDIIDVVPNAVVIIVELCHDKDYYSPTGLKQCLRSYQSILLVRVRVPRRGMFISLELSVHSRSSVNVYRWEIRKL